MSFVHALGGRLCSAWAAGYNPCVDVVSTLIQVSFPEDIVLDTLVKLLALSWNNAP